jgi:hypothetical protein
MKKPREIKRLRLNRETLANLNQMEGAELEKIAGGHSNPCTGGTSCLPGCTCQ